MLIWSGGSYLVINRGSASWQEITACLIGRPQTSQKVLNTIISYYPRRRSDEQDEAMCDTGAISTSKGTGRIPWLEEVVYRG
jgi:hypothetical protein